MKSFPTHSTDTPRARSRAPIAAAATLAVLSFAGCAAPETQVTHIYDAPAGVEFEAAEYGTVRRIDVVETSEQPTGGGAVLGGVLGGVLGNQIGSGTGRGAATVLGAFGGALLGNNIEQKRAAADSRRYYNVVVQFDRGGTRSFSYYELNGLHVGERVKLDHGVLGRA